MYRTIHHLPAVGHVIGSWALYTLLQGKWDLVGIQIHPSTSTFCCCWGCWRLGHVVFWHRHDMRHEKLSWRFCKCSYTMKKQFNWTCWGLVHEERHPSRQPPETWSWSPVTHREDKDFSCTHHLLILHISTGLGSFHLCPNIFQLQGLMFYYCDFTAFLPQLRLLFFIHLEVTWPQF